MNKRVLVALLAGLMMNFAIASTDTWEFESPQQQALFQTLVHELRCPKCQNQNIADSEAMIAQDLKRKVYELVKQGQTEAQVIDYMKVRYGDFVYYQPPVNTTTVWLWLLPIGFVLLGFILIWRRPHQMTDVMDEDLLKQADSMLEKDQ